MSRYAKFIVACVPVLVAALNAIQDALSNDAVVSQAEWVSLIVATLTAIGVYAVPNRPPAGVAGNPRISEQG